MNNKIKCPYCGSYKIEYHNEDDEYYCRECCSNWKEKIYKIKKQKVDTKYGIYRK